MKAFLYLALLFSGLLNFAFVVLSELKSLTPLIPLIAATGAVFGALIVARSVTTHWQMRITEKQIYTQIIIAEWNHMAATWRDAKKKDEPAPPMPTLVEKMIAAGILKNNAPKK